MKQHIEKFSSFEKVYEQVKKTTKKVDQDGDGDTDFVDAKIAQYTNGGIPKPAAIKKAKIFAKKNGIKDSNKKA